jgi:hypothetical protein
MVASRGRLIILILVDEAEHVEGVAVAPGFADQLLHQLNRTILVSRVAAPVQRESEELPHLGRLLRGTGARPRPARSPDPTATGRGIAAAR